MRRGVAVVGVLAIGAVTACSHGAGRSGVGSATTAPKPISGAGVIVFEGGTGPAERLYAISPGGRERRLGDAQGFDPQLSPDGREVAFSRPRAAQPSVSDAFVRSMVTGDERAVTNGTCPTWTRDGTALVVSTPIGLRRAAVSGRSLAVIPGAATQCGLEVGRDRYVLWDQGERLDLLAGGKVRPLVTMTSCALGPVAVDPSGSRIAFTAACPHEAGGLYLAPLAAPTPFLVLAGVAYGAAWSPDGGSLATSHRPSAFAEHQLWLATADGETRRRIAGDIVNAPTWGPTPR